MSNLIPSKKIKVLIVDDSLIIQSLLKRILASDPIFEVVGQASNPFEARDLIKKTNPDVLTLDIIMPKMDGITFLKNLMRLRPMPVIMLSSLTQQNAELALEALSIGAVDYLPKPSKQAFDNLTKFSNTLIKMVKQAAKTQVKRYVEHSPLKKPIGEKDKTGLQGLDNPEQNSMLKKNLIAIGASVGGIEAIESLLLQLPKVMPGIVITQHVKKELNTAFQKRLNKLCPLTVLQSQDQAIILPGRVYISTPGVHLVVHQQNSDYVIGLEDTPKVSGHRPSVDALFYSVAKAAGKNAIGILLTGMGSDGALGLKAIQEAGGTTIAQDKSSSVVWGMPGSAVKLNAADYVLPLDQIPNQILRILETR